MFYCVWEYIRFLDGRTVFASITWCVVNVSSILSTVASDIVIRSYLFCGSIYVTKLVAAVVDCGCMWTLLEIMWKFGGIMHMEFST